MNNKDILAIIKTLAVARAPSGLEKARGEQFKKEMEKLLTSKDIPVNSDSLGNYFAKLKGEYITNFLISETILKQSNS